MYETTISLNMGFCYRCAVSQRGEAHGQQKGRQLQVATEHLTVVVVVVVVVVAVVAANIILIKHYKATLPQVYLVISYIFQ